MSLTFREFWAAAHGMILGALFLLAFGGGLAGLYSLRLELLTAEGIRERLPRIKWGTGIMAVVAWLTVITGTYIVYPWYRATPPEGATDLSAFPRSFLRADATLACCLVLPHPRHRSVLRHLQICPSIGSGRSPQTDADDPLHPGVCHGRYRRTTRSANHQSCPGDVTCAAH